MRRPLVLTAVTALLAGLLAGPAAAVSDPVVVVDDIEAPLSQGQTAEGTAIGWGSFQDPESTFAYQPSDSPPAPRPDAGPENTVLEVTTEVAAFTGVSHFFTDDTVTEWVPQDWSGYEGFALWVYGQDTGTGLFVDVLDNRTPGSTSDDAERWTVSFVDDFSGWQLLEWTWDEFARKGVGNGAPDDGFGLSEVHGWAFGATSTGGAEVTWYLDDVQVFGVRPLELAWSSPIIGVDESVGTATATATLTRPSDTEITVDVVTADVQNRTSSEDLIATPDRDYVPTSATLTFAPGETEATFSVEVLDDGRAEVDETVHLHMRDVTGVEDPGPAGRTSLSITDDDPVDPRLVESFEDRFAPALLGTTGATSMSAREIAAGDADARPGQEQFETVLDVSGEGTAGREFPLPEDFSAASGLTFWLYGTGDGSELDVTLLDNRAPDPGPDGWELTWSDEFDAAAGEPADPESWTYETGGWGWGNQELQYYTDSTDNAAHDGQGNLVITTREVEDPEAADLPCWYGPCTHTSARLITEGKQEFAYGRIEARVRTGDGTGIWPAFWSLGNDFREVGWPQTGEIDVMEYVGRIPGEIFGTIHGPGYSGGESFSSGQIQVDPGPPEDFLEYAIIWQPGLIEWEVTDGDGTRKYHEAMPADVAPDEWVFEHPFTLLLNVALGGNFGGALGDDLDLPQETRADWVRVYQAPDSAERFTATVVDDTAGWSQVSVPFGAFERDADQPEGAPDDGLTLSEVWGWQVGLPDDQERSLDAVRLGLVTPSGAEVERVAGEDRVATSVALSQRQHADGAADAVLARSDLYADALYGGPLAASVDGPVLLTGGDGLDERVAGELARLGVERVWLVGGTAALSEQVETAAAEQGEVVRFAGQTRAETAALVAEQLDGDGAYLVRGYGERGWVDAVSASGLAARDGSPILPARDGQLPAATLDALCSREDVVVVGGTAAVPGSAVDALQGCDATPAVTRVGGADRYDTSGQLFARGLDGAEGDVWLATGSDYPDALSAGPAAGEGVGLLLVDPAAAGLADVLVDLLDGDGQQADGVVVVGGTAALPRTLEQALLATG